MGCIYAFFLRKIDSMFNKIILSTVAVSVLFTSSDGFAGRRNQLSQPKAQAIYDQTMKNLQKVPPQVEQKYRKLIQSGDPLFDVRTISEMLMVHYKATEAYHNKLLVDAAADLATLESGIDTDSLAFSFLPSVFEDSSPSAVITAKKEIFRCFLEDGKRSPSLKRLKDEVSSGEEFFTNMFSNPDALLDQIALDVGEMKNDVDAFMKYERMLYRRSKVAVERHNAFADYHEGHPERGKIRTFDKLREVWENIASVSSCYILFVKAAYPFVCALEKLTPSTESAVFQLKVREIKRGIKNIAAGFGCGQMICEELDMLDELYNTLTADDVLPLNEDLAVLYNTEAADHEMNPEGKYQKKVKNDRLKLDQFYQHLERQVDGSVTKFLLAQKELERREKERQKERAHARLVKNIKAMQADREAEVREAEALKQQTASTSTSSSSSASTSSTSTSSTSELPRELSSQGQYMQWFVESGQKFNARKEVNQQLVKLMADQKRKEDAKASKNHEIDPDRVASSSSSSSSTTVEVAPATVDPQITLGANHYKTFFSLMNDKYSEMELPQVENLFIAIGGYVDNAHEGARVGMGLRHIETAAPVVKIMHAPHASGKNGRKGFGPEHILDIRNMLIAAGFTMESVISR